MNRLLSSLYVLLHSGRVLLAMSFVVVFLTMSCTKDLTLEVKRPSPVLVLNSVVAPGSPVKVAVQRTVYLTESHKRVNPVADARVRLMVNGQLQGLLTWSEQEQLYVSSYEPKGGDRIAVEVVAEQERATAEVIVPQLVPLDSVGVRFVYYGQEKETALSSGDSECRYFLRFHDAAGAKNYYFVRILDNYGNSVRLNLTNEEVFRDAFAGLNGIDESSAIDGSNGAAFADDLFDGQTYVLRLGELFFSGGHAEAWHEGWRTIQLYAVSETYYKYLTRIFNDGDLSLSENLAKVGLSEPVVMASNVEGGTGMLGAFQMLSRRVYVKRSETKNELEIGDPPKHGPIYSSLLRP